MRNLESKLRPAVYNLKWENGKTNCNQQYLIEDAKPEKETATSIIKFKMRNLKSIVQPAVYDLKCENGKTHSNKQYLIEDAKPEKQTATSSI